MNGFQVGQVVKGAVCGTFLIVGFRQIGGEAHAQVKAFNVELNKAARGEFALPLAALKA